MDFTGRLVHIGQLEQFETSRGTTVLTREIVVTTDEQFPKSGCFTLRNDLAQNFAHSIGATVTVKFDITMRSNKEQTRYFNQLNVWRIN